MQLVEISWCKDICSLMNIFSFEKQKGNSKDCLSQPFLSVLFRIPKKKFQTNLHILLQLQTLTCPVHTYVCFHKEISFCALLFTLQGSTTLQRLSSADELSIKYIIYDLTFEMDALQM